jgi:hypothetical protein
MLNQGYTPRSKLQLANPVAAVRSVSLDPYLQKPLAMADGRQLTPLEIQQAYLADCEAFAAEHPLPDWGRELLVNWGAVLTLLSRDVRQLAGKLDAYTKLVLYDHELSRAGYSWNDLRSAVALLSRLRHEHPEHVVHALITQDSKSLPPEQHPALASAESLVKSSRPLALEQLRFLLRLQVLDLRYHELGGLYDEFAQAGHAYSIILTDEQIESATTTAPPGGRAQRRGELVKQHHADAHWTAGWQLVSNRTTGESIDLSNPFDSQGKPTTMKV